MIPKLPVAMRPIAHRSSRRGGALILALLFMGVVTTAIFWGVEYGFWHAFGTAQMRYLGGAIATLVSGCDSDVAPPQASADDASRRAALPPSSAARRCSTTSFVGFMMRE